MKFLTVLILGLISVSANLKAIDNTSDTTINEGLLVPNAKNGLLNDEKTSASRTEKFQILHDETLKILEEKRHRRKVLLDEIESLETIFSVNDKTLKDRQYSLDQRLGSLKDVFGSFKQLAGETRAEFENSITSAQLPDRSGDLKQLISDLDHSYSLVSIAQLESLFSKLSSELFHSGEVVKFTAPIVGYDGTIEQKEITRIGNFNAISNEGYLIFSGQPKQLSLLERQPARKYVALARELAKPESEYQPFAIDPSSGQLLTLLIERPNVIERIKQGGSIAYIIIALGLASIMFGTRHYYKLGKINKINQQQALTLTFDSGSPIKNLFEIERTFKSEDIESLELKLSESIAAENSKMGQIPHYIKFIAMVAPLLGLLGTVAGMIETFQSISLFGTGDPKFMAGGISKALITTVLGLLAAIPSLLLATMLTSKIRIITEQLDSFALSLIEKYEEKKKIDAN